MNHSKQAAIFNKDIDRTSWHDETLWFVRQKRDKSVYNIPDFQLLRELASQIKEHTLSKLNDYLTAFEQNANRNGVKVHWAADAKAHNDIVLGILQQHKAQKIVKSKSMLTEECHLNPFLEKNGIEVVDTDLGERIIQLRGESPSHIVLPAIHLKKEDVGKTFHQHLHTPKGEKDPQRLTQAARQHLREKFLKADAALTGVNFAIAETGSVVVCTNEGNADLGVNLAKVHIACMGIEKIIPRFKDLSVFTRLLARSATGQPVTTYTSHFTKPRSGAEMHIIIVDNGRTQQLGRKDFYNSLKCIRCGACMNTCPVYRRSGGHSYDFTVPGPIGSILAPNLDLKKYSSLPFASTLCGSCTNVCPVKINIHEQLYKWRQEIGEANSLPVMKKWTMKGMAKVLASARLFSFIGAMGRQVLKWTPHFITHNKMINPWAKARELPKTPQESFREWYSKNRQKN
ncbi:lactate utilization protein B [Solitalea lacus]|uniref:lactate utilization protein B n=1 Tax=Solitalea lacus TaxID=2911172 RepID=UPI001EDC4812|nr:lactate utilization protein B [Solitalea lacus]UKJ08185.1 lactate utilization protein [Solitalea lacus]